MSAGLKFRMIFLEFWPTLIWDHMEPYGTRKDKTDPAGQYVALCTCPPVCPFACSSRVGQNSKKIILNFSPALIFVYGL